MLLTNGRYICTYLITLTASVPGRQRLLVPLSNMLPCVTIQAVMIMQKYHANITHNTTPPLFQRLCIPDSLFLSFSLSCWISDGGHLAVRGVCHIKSSHYGRAVNCHKLNVDSNEKNNLHLTGELHLHLHAHGCRHGQNAVAGPAVCIIQLNWNATHSAAPLDITGDLPSCLMSASFTETLNAVYVAIWEDERYENRSRGWGGSSVELSKWSWSFRDGGGKTI